MRICERSLWLARASQTLDIPYLHLSAARVFAGDVNRLYREDDYPDGESSIALLLTQAEDCVRDHCERHVILRTGPVFSGAGVNVVTHMLGQLQQGGTLTLSRRHQGCPSPRRGCGQGGVRDAGPVQLRRGGLGHLPLLQFRCHQLLRVC